MIATEQLRAAAIVPDISVAHAVQVLVIDDDVDLWPLVETILGTLKVGVNFAEDAVNGIAMAKLLRPDVILLDHSLPDGTALDVLRSLRSDETLRAIPVVVVTSRSDSETLAACFESGAADFVRKPLLAAELRARLQIILDRQRLMGDLARAACQDPLTGLPNRALLVERLQSAIDGYQRVDEDFALLFLDLDRFKLINDTMGHSVGDRVLNEIADRLINVSASSASAYAMEGIRLVARVGGDEFAILVATTTSGPTVDEIADRLLSVVGVPLLLEEHWVHITASVGIVHGHAEYQRAEDMLRDADIAMYEAKARGKGCHARFFPPMRVAIRQRVQLERCLRDAIGTSQITMVYQPIIDLNDGHLASVEALVRWDHPELGRILPADFIPMAEETRLIIPLSEHILRQACHDFVLWQQLWPTSAPRYVSVNVSRVQLSDPNLLSRTLAIIHEASLSPGDLLLEVTESELMEHKEIARELLSAFRANHIRIAMDDFGAGYSSLACLQEFEFDVLKIDRGLTEQIGREGNAPTLLRSVTTLAEGLGLQVVAEGVERYEQLAFLRELGCHFGQGYLLARPMSASQLQQWWAGAARPRL